MTALTLTALTPAALDPRPRPPEVSQHHSERSAWRSRWDKDPSLSPTEKRILEMLRRRLNKHNACWPSQKTIARDCGNISIRTVGRALRKLEGQWITRVRRHNRRTGNRTSDLIQIRCPTQDTLRQRSLDPERFDMPVAYRVEHPPTEAVSTEPVQDGSFSVSREGGLSDKLALGLEDKMSEEPSVQREPQDSVLQAAICRSMQGPDRPAVAAGQAEAPEDLETQPRQPATPNSPQQPPPPVCTAQTPPGLEPEVANLCVLWRELLQDPEHEEERRYTFRALKLSMLRGYNARVLLTALAMLLDKLAHRRRGLRPIRNIAEYYGSLLDVANQDPEKTGGGQEWECRMWTPDQLQRIKRGARPHQVLANPDRVRLAEQEAPPEPMERPPLVTPGVSSQPDLPLSGVADLVRKSRRASPNSVAKSLLERVGGDLEALAEAWMAAGGPSEALSLLEYARAERRAMGLDG